MSIRLTCKSCRESYAVNEDLAGKRVRCRKCETILRVPEPPAEEEEEPERRPAKRTSSDLRRGDDPPRRRRDEDESPRRRHDRDRDEDDERPKRRSVKKKGSNLPLILGGGGVLLVVGVVVGVMLMGKSKKPAEPRIIGHMGDRPRVDAPQVPQAGPGAIAPDDVARVKRSTVMLRVELPNGGGGEGTGFFALAPGLVITNAHVLGMLHHDSPIPGRVNVIVGGGEPGEFTLPGKVLGVDRDNDLAVVRVEAAGRALPPTLAVGEAEKLHETQKVYIFGYPLGSRLGRNLTVSESSVSSLRRDQGGMLEQVQVNGGMHHGNSGGPVTDNRGTVVAVAVAGIRGTQLNFAIPAEYVHYVGVGRLTGEDVGSAYASGGRNYLPVRLMALDPLRQLRQVKLDLWSGPPGPPRAGGNAAAQAPGDGPRVTTTANERNGDYQVNAAMPVVGAGQVLWMQASVVAEGTFYMNARPLTVEQAVVLVREEADLRWKTPTAPTLRSLRMKNSSKVTIYKGDDAAVISQDLDAPVVEKLSRDTRGLGTSVRLGFGRPVFTREAFGKKMTAPDDIGGTLTQFSPSFLVDFTNQAKEKGARDFSGIPDDNRRSMVQSLFRTVSNTWEMTTLPYPNRVVRPSDAWTARIPMLVELEAGSKIIDLQVTCIYEGTWTVGGRKMGHVRLTGQAHSREGGKEAVGKFMGRAVIDVAGGYTKSVSVALSSEVETGDADVRVLFTNESTVEREEGNAAGLPLPEG